MMNEDRYVEVEETGLGQRITNSFVGILLGIALFFGSFVVLYWNEGRIDFSQVAKQAIEISPTAANDSAKGKLVTTTGEIVSDEVLGDDLFLKPGEYIALNRITEMFAWYETKDTRTEKKAGGSEKKITTYSYSKKWQNKPKDSSEFKKSAKHHNPDKAIADFSARVERASIGIYDLNMDELSFFKLQEIQLNPEILTLKDEVSLAGNYLFKGNSTIDNPQVGDLRIKYLAIPNNAKVTIFGKLLANNKIDAYFHEGKHKFYQMFLGSKEEAIHALKARHKILTWSFRLLGLGMMWMSLTLFIEPLGVVLDVVPFLGNFTRGIVGASAFIIAFCLSTITILISMLLHNLIALAIAIAVAITAGFILRQWRVQNSH